MSVMVDDKTIPKGQLISEISCYALAVVNVGPLNYMVYDSIGWRQLSRHASPSAAVMSMWRVAHHLRAQRLAREKRN
jgi:hypothetical protein